MHWCNSKNTDIVWYECGYCLQWLQSRVHSRYYDCPADSPDCLLEMQVCRNCLDLLVLAKNAKIKAYVKFGPSAYTKAAIELRKKLQEKKEERKGRQKRAAYHRSCKF